MWKGAKECKVLRKLRAHPLLIFSSLIFLPRTQFTAIPQFGGAHLHSREAHDHAPSSLASRIRNIYLFLQAKTFQLLDPLRDTVHSLQYLYIEQTTSENLPNHRVSAFSEVPKLRVVLSRNVGSVYKDAVPWDCITE